ncbi:MAG: phage holin family protein [bacterium]|nr:phage holin family protein [bacterium]
MGFILRWFGYALAVMLVAYIIPGIEVDGFMGALIAAVVLGLVNTFIKPIVTFIALPLNFLTLGLFALVINALLLWGVGALAPGLEVEGFWSAFFGAIILSIVIAIVDGITKKK